MSTLIPRDQLRFKNGSPQFEFDECYKGAENNDSFYRLINTETQVWAFYNDSTENVVKVKARFGIGSKIEGLQRTRIVKILSSSSKSESKEDDDSKLYEWEAFLEVDPGYTELFVKGEISSYVIELYSEAAPAKSVAFEYRVPSVPYDKIYKCFKDKGNGLLFRLVDERHKTWAFYNDTQTYVMKVTVDFIKKDEVEPLKNTKVSTDQSSSCDGVVYVLEIQPGETEMFISGAPTSYKLGFSAEPISNMGENPNTVEFINGSPNPAVIPHHSHIFKCFKNHGNGLMFRIVDDINKIWAFYNDTTDFIMTAISRVPAGELFQPAPGVQVMSDEDKKTTILTLQVPPLTTVPFLIGEPQSIEINFSATLIRDVIGINEPRYENGGPNPNIIQPNVVHKCFKEHGNGLLFRLEDTKRHLWAFYNDTNDTVMTVKMSITESMNLKLLGGTKIVQDPEMGEIYTVEVPPAANSSVHSRGCLCVQITLYSG